VESEEESGRWRKRETGRKIDGEAGERKRHTGRG
jgi:hypothetical protein